MATLQQAAREYAHAVERYEGDRQGAIATAEASLLAAARAFVFEEAAALAAPRPVPGSRGGDER
jgi:hypothetical protein